MTEAVYDFKEIKKHVRTPYIFEPYKDANADRLCINYREDLSSTDKDVKNCWCYKAGQNGAHIPCPPRPTPPIIIQVEKPSKL